MDGSVTIMNGVIGAAWRFGLGVQSSMPMDSHGSQWVPMVSLGVPTGPHGVPMGPHGSPWVPMGPHGFPWGSHGVPMGPHGFPWGPMGSHGLPRGSMASMENPRMSETVDFNENHYSVRQKIGEPGSKSIRNIFPLHPVTSKRPESPYGAKKQIWAENPVFQFFCLLDPYWTHILLS